MEAACGPEPVVYDDSPESIAYQECNQTFYGGLQWDLSVPASAYGDFQLMDAILSLIIGSAALLLTFPVIARRRPS